MTSETTFETRFFQDDNEVASINYCFSDKKFELTTKSTTEYSKKEIKTMLKDMLKFIEEVK